MEQIEVGGKVGTDAMAAIHEYLKERAIELIPSTMVTGLCGISEASLRYHQKKDKGLVFGYVSIGLRAVQVVPLKEVLRVFFDDGPDGECRDFLAKGREAACFTFFGGEVYRILYSGMMDRGKVELLAMRHAYRQGTRKPGAPRRNPRNDS